jgi:hypothetical protein
MHVVAQKLPRDRVVEKLFLIQLAENVRRNVKQTQLQISVELANNGRLHSQ